MDGKPQRYQVNRDCDRTQAGLYREFLPSSIGPRYNLLGRH